MQQQLLDNIGNIIGIFILLLLVVCSIINMFCCLYRVCDKYNKRKYDSETLGYVPEEIINETNSLFV
jgi:hypothetical protein